MSTGRSIAEPALKQIRSCPLVLVQAWADRANIRSNVPETWSDRPVSDLFLFGFGRAACISENRSGTVNPRDDDGSLVPPGDTGSSRSGGPARASPTQSRTAAPPSRRSHPPNWRPTD